MTKKLSEVISAVWSDDEVMSTGVTKSQYRAMYDAARALEERVAELERTARENRNWREAHAEATARAEAAETLATNLDRQCDDLGEELDRIEKQLYEACGERDVAEHEVARLRVALSTEQDTFNGLLDERDALRGKLEKVLAAAVDGFPIGEMSHILAILDGDSE